MISRIQQMLFSTLVGIMPAAIVVLMLVMPMGCKPKPLPEQGSAGAELYSQRCGGTCHNLYYPTVMTADMWTAMVERMDSEMSRRGVPLAAVDKDEILAYLRRNSGGR